MLEIYTVHFPTGYAFAVLSNGALLFRSAPEYASHEEAYVAAQAWIADPGPQQWPFGEPPETALDLNTWEPPCKVTHSFKST